MPLALAGRRILVTREAEKAAETGRAIEARGGVPVPFPCIATVPPADEAPLRAALATRASFDRIVVTSPTGARVLASAAGPGGLSPSALGAARLFAVGRATARVLEAAGGAGVRVPGRQDGDGLLAALLDDGAAAGRTLVLRAEQGREVVVEGLRAAGGSVEAVVAYRTVRATPAPAEIEGLRAGPRLDAALFLSPSAVDGFWALVGEEGVRALLAGAVTVAIGPTTAAALEGRGHAPVLVPPRPDLETVLDALAERLGPGLR
jgi:uroporphyrinogen-III synthase